MRIRQNNPRNPIENGLIIRAWRELKLAPLMLDCRKRDHGCVAGRQGER
jgi:hypothetical protein